MVVIVYIWVVVYSCIILNTMWWSLYVVLYGNTVWKVECRVLSRVQEMSGMNKGAN